jgi:hypothetical protein
LQFLLQCQVLETRAAFPLQGRGAAAMNVSLDSASPGVYQTVKGVKGFGKVIENLGRYAASATDIQSIHNQIHTISQQQFSGGNRKILPFVRMDRRKTCGIFLQFS